MATNPADAEPQHETPVTPESISQEISVLRRRFPQVSLHTVTSSFLTASYERTRYSRIRFTLTFPEGYPSHCLIVDVTSDDVVPPGLKKKVEREMGKAASDCEGTYEQMGAVFHWLVKFVDENKFVPCWRELRKCVELVASAKSQTPASTITLQELKGKISLRLRSDKYFYFCTIVVDDGYPNTSQHVNYGKPCSLKMESTNFPPKIELLLTSQAQEIVRRMQDGMTASEALKMSNPMKDPQHAKNDGRDASQVRLTQDALKGLKKDTETLSYVRDLRNVNSATVQGNAKIKAHAAKERKDARRTINKLTTNEIAKDMEHEAKEKQWQAEEQARIAGYQFTEHDGSNPQRSLFSLVTFLTQKIQNLPKEKCPVCRKPSLPSDPGILKALYLKPCDAKTEREKKARKDAKLKRPVRTYCGCWYHYQCLDEFMTEPPFGAACPTEGCGRRVYHPDWPSEMKELERAWANRQARAREIEDAAMFL